MENWRTSWADRKATLAERLKRGECGGGYSDAVIILCAGISAIAAEAWPGKGIDRVRFVELLVTLSPVCKLVSVPLLVGHLRNAGLIDASVAIRKAYLPASRSQVVTGPEVDKDEHTILNLRPELLQGVDLREYSYANLLYERLRSSMVHEYRAGEKAVSISLTDAQDPPVSYFNWIDEEDRHIYFHIPWLAIMLRTAAARNDAEAATLGRKPPAIWWIQGK